MKTLSNGDGYTNVCGDLTRVHRAQRGASGKGVHYRKGIRMTHKRLEPLGWNEGFAAIHVARAEVEQLRRCKAQS
jgi:hypothetical protein